MDKPQIFNHQMFGELPVIVIEGCEWFGATEAAKSLSFTNPHDAIRNHVDEPDCAVRSVGVQTGVKADGSPAIQAVQKKFVNESGLYGLIFGAARQSNNPDIKEKAQRFKRWVTSEVLPTIRKHGMYAKDELLDNPDLLLDVVSKLKDERDKRIAAENRIELDKPKVIFAEAVTASKSSILVGELAKILKQNGIEIGQNRLFEWLRSKGYLIKRNGTDYNMPTQYSMELGLFEIKETVVNHSDGHISVSKTPKVTGTGQVYFINKFKGSTKLA